MISARFIALLALAASLPFSEAQLPEGWTLSITNPNAGTQWDGGKEEIITWDVNSTGNDNPKGSIYLSKDGRARWKHHLASNFNITAGEVEIQVPRGISGTYEVIMVSEHETVGRSLDFTITE